MSEFEYLSVFISIIFGISVTHILSGAIRSIYRGQIDETHFVLTAFLFLVLILNWWTGYRWKDHADWSFDIFLIIIFWSVIHYIAAITLYPPQVSGTEHPLEYRRKWFLWTFVSLVFADIIQTAALGDILKPWIYLPFVLHYLVISLLAIFINRPGFHRWTARYFLLSMTVWSLVIRRFLV